MSSIGYRGMRKRAKNHPPRGKLNLLSCLRGGALDKELFKRYNTPNKMLDGRGERVRMKSQAYMFCVDKKSNCFLFEQGMVLFDGF